MFNVYLAMTGGGSALKNEEVHLNLQLIIPCTRGALEPMFKVPDGNRSGGNQKKVPARTVTY
jgi:hypothetical protein